MSNNVFNRPPKTDIVRANEELETERTIGLSRVLPADPPDDTISIQDVEPVEAASQHDYETERAGVAGLTAIDNDEDPFPSAEQPIAQAPGRMVSPRPDPEDATVQTLVDQGVTREASEGMVEEHSIVSEKSDEPEASS
jgi:hypothetical protein